MRRCKAREAGELAASVTFHHECTPCDTTLCNYKKDPPRIIACVPYAHTALQAFTQNIQRIRRAPGCIGRRGYTACTARMLAAARCLYHTAARHRPPARALRAAGERAKNASNFARPAADQCAAPPARARVQARAVAGAGAFPRRFRTAPPRRGVTRRC